eukprot:Pompholyxophrys_punicea_v1_NODE_665_length_1494_cov_19.362752.p1 type:complete len:438 gc:universal NODE_665_length_1494_cov_19.362752:1346-33(-)
MDEFKKVAFSSALKYAMYLFGMIVIVEGQPFVKQHLKKKQIDAIWAIVNGMDVMTILPTGFGKSLIYQMLPFIMDFISHGDESRPFEIKPQKFSCVIISPLIVLMQDQIVSLSQLGVVAARWCASDAKFVQNLSGNPALIYVSPEAFLNSKTCLSIILKCRITCIVVDEAHCIATWGSEFRSAYHSIGDIRAFFPSTPVLALTATATSEIKLEITERLYLKNVKLIEETPILENVRLDVSKRNLWPEFLRKSLMELRVLRKMAPRKIFFCGSQSQVGELFAFFQEEFEGEQYDENEAQIEKRLFAMFHKDTLEEFKLLILNTLKNPNSPIRYVFATIAFGMGVNCAFREVIHLGSPRKLEDYVQQIGRVGRDGKEAHAYLFWDGNDLKQAAEEMKNYCNDETRCKREIIANHFNFDVLKAVDGEVCCCVCAVQSKEV